MIYEVIFTILAVALLALLLLIYYKKQSFKNCRSYAYKAILVVSFILCIFEFIYVLCLKLFDIGILSTVLYKLYTI